MPRTGSLCSGYRGLDMAVEAVFGGTTAWVSDVDPGASKILAHHWPNVPNLGDLTAVDWAAVEPVDIVCGGYPCQPFSSAGLRRGVEDERHIWPYIADALRVLRPRYAIFENVAGHLGRGFDTVLADLADLGFDVEWCTVRASEVGAPHRRERLFILAAAQDADGSARGQRRLAAPGQTQSRGARSDAGGRGGAPSADSQGAGLEGPRLPGRPADGGAVATDAPGERRGARRPESAGQQGRLGATGGRGAAPADPEGDERGRLPESGRDAVQHGLRPGSDGRGPAPASDPDSSGQRAAELDLRARQPDAAWGAYLPAIRRWEHATGRPAPRATDLRNRLNPEFVEWLMGLPAGHVTAVPGLTRNQSLHALGNGVIPQQATAALRLLADRRSVAA